MVNVKHKERVHRRRRSAKPASHSGMNLEFFSQGSEGQGENPSALGGARKHNAEAAMPSKDRSPNGRDSSRAMRPRTTGSLRSRAQSPLTRLGSACRLSRVRRTSSQSFLFDRVVYRRYYRDYSKTQ